MIDAGGFPNVLQVSATSGETELERRVLRAHVPPSIQPATLWFRNLLLATQAKAFKHFLSGRGCKKLHVEQPLQIQNLDSTYMTAIIDLLAKSDDGTFTRFVDANYDGNWAES